jgi:hypothetical protein
MSADTQWLAIDLYLRWRWLSVGCPTGEPRAFATSPGEYYWAVSSPTRVRAPKSKENVIWLLILYPGHIAGQEPDNGCGTPNLAAVRF